jgi:hypothetical protein
MTRDGGLIWGAARVLTRKSQIRTWIAILVVFLIGVVAYPGVRSYAEWYSNRFIPVPYYSNDEQLVEKAVGVLYGRDKDLAWIKTSAYPVVVDLPEMKCVGFNLRRGTYGRGQTVCFSKANGSEVVRYLHD